MQGELIDEVLQHLDEFENTGDWFHFSLALDALDDLKKQIESNKMNNKEKELREKLAKTIENRPDSQRIKDSFLIFVENAPVSMLCDFDTWCMG